MLCLYAMLCMCLPTIIFSPHWPVVVEVTELVGEPLDVVWLKPRGIADHIEMCGCDRPLTHTLAHNEEVIPVHAHTHTHTL